MCCQLILSANSLAFPETLLLRHELCLNTLQTVSFLLSLCFSAPPCEARSLLTPLRLIQGETTNLSSLASIQLLHHVSEIHLKYHFFFTQYFACMFFFFICLFTAFQLPFSGNSPTLQFCFEDQLMSRRTLLLLR